MIAALFLLGAVLFGLYEADQSDLGVNVAALAASYARQAHGSDTVFVLRANHATATLDVLGAYPTQADAIQEIARPANRGLEFYVYAYPSTPGAPPTGLAILQGGS